MNDDNARPAPVRKFEIVLREVKNNGITVKQCDTIRNVLSDLVSETGIQLAWVNAMLDAGITSKELSCSEPPKRK